MLNDIDYVILMEQVQKEFSIENLLFITIMLQWQEYLISNKYWNENNRNCKLIGFLDDDIDKRQIKLPPNVPLSPMIDELESKCDENTNNNNGDNNKFEKCFKDIYKKYIENKVAPLEINICGETRDVLREYYDEIITRDRRRNRNINVENELKDVKNLQYVPSDTEDPNSLDFWKLWYHLVQACDQVFVLLIPVLMRCYKNMVHDES